MKKILMALLVVVGALFATSVPANFQTIDPTYHVSTGLQFTSDFTLSVVSGEVASGDEDNLQNGDEVCSGATLRVTPTVSSKFATSDFLAVSAYPTCSGGYCPAMIAYSTVNHNQNIGWLSSGTWDTEKSYGDANPISTVISHYDTLGHSSFHTEPVTYMNGSGTYANKEGGVGIFCKGTYQVTDGATVKGSSSMPTTSNVDFTVTTAGAHPISTKLSGVDCFAVILKHPTNIDDNPAYFRLYYFTSNLPDIDPTIATDTISVTVATSGGTASFNEVPGSVSASSSLLDEDQIMVKVTEHNYGDPVRITGVTSSNPSYTAMAFPVSLCDALGFPPSLCPASNGFNSDIATGANKDLYVLLVRGGGASGGTVLTFTGTTASATCGSAASGSDTVDLTGAVTCDIAPESLELSPLTVAAFTVACEDLAGNPVACSGNNWYLDGLEGDFTARTSSYAWMYSTSPPGTSGTLNYRSGIAHCLSDIDVTDDGLGSEYECEFLPPSATMNISSSRYFDLNCFVNDTPSDPDDAEYDTINGLGGSTSNSSTDGTTYNAPGSPDTGDLRGIASWASMPSGMEGKVALAPINVINGSGGNDTNNTPNDPDNPGSTQWCTIGTSTLSVFPGDSGYVGIMCGPPSNLTACTDVVWTTEGDVVLTNADVYGTEYTINGDPHTSGKIKAVVDGTPGHICWLDFYVMEPECWEYS